MFSSVLAVIAENFTTIGQFIMPVLYCLKPQLFSGCIRLLGALWLTTFIRPGPRVSDNFIGDNDNDNAEFHHFLLFYDLLQ